MNEMKITGNGNIVIQSHLGSGDNIAGNKIVINQATMKEQVQDLVSKGKIDEAIKMLGTSSDTALLAGRWNQHKLDEMLGMLSFSEASQGRNRIVAAILSYAGCDEDVMIQQSKPTPNTSQSWKDILLQIIKSSSRQNKDLERKATSLLEAIQGHFNTKAIRAFYDRTGEKEAELFTELESLKKEVERSQNENIGEFIDRVVNHISAAIPGWESIGDAYVLCQGRGLQSGFIDRNLNAQPNDDAAKLEAVEIIETFLGKL